jgi:pyoverdine/dityrosine biosynthesis protein Dit1
MTSAVLTKLNPAVNGVNRFISSSAAPRKPWRWYQENPKRGSREVTVIDEAALIGRVRELAASLNNSLPTQSTVSNFDGFLAALRALFSAPELLLGDVANVQATLERQRPLLEKLYRAGAPLTFTLLGYPNKMPNPLYTRSTGADLGEMISLMKLSEIATRIKGFYAPGARIRVLTENTIFFGMSGLSEHEQHHYFLDIARWSTLLSISDRVLVEDVVAHHTSELEQRWSAITEELREKYRRGDSETTEMVQAVLPTNFMTLNFRGYPEEVLVRLFDPTVEDRSLESLRGQLLNRAIEESFGYLAYHQARYRMGFMEAAFPDSLRLTVAPQVGSFGIQMLNRTARMLPYYGYVVASGAEFNFEYLIDVPDHARAIYLENRLEHPMFFEVKG